MASVVAQGAASRSPFEQSNITFPLRVYYKYKKCLYSENSLVSMEEKLKVLLFLGRYELLSVLRRCSRVCCCAYASELAKPLRSTSGTRERAIERFIYVCACRYKGETLFGRALGELSMKMYEEACKLKLCVKETTGKRGKRFTDNAFVTMFYAPSEVGTRCPLWRVVNALAGTIPDPRLQELPPPPAVSRGMPFHCESAG